MSDRYFASVSKNCFDLLVAVILSSAFYLRRESLAYASYDWTIYNPRVHTSELVAPNRLPG